MVNSQSFFTAAAAVLVTSVDAWSPSNSYAPANVSCPQDAHFLREASNELSQNESQWLSKRDTITSEAMQEFLNRTISAAFNSSSSFKDLLSAIDDSSSPRIGVACSGGGYRAMLIGAGMLAAMDNRTNGATEHGLGGLLQAATYLAGLSGGNWLVGTLAWNNWTSVQSILDNMTQENSIWDISNSLVNPGGDNTTESLLRWESIFKQVASKTNAGFNTTLADYWGRALAYSFFPSLPNGGEAYTWSALRDSTVFKNALMPFPISVADVRHPYAGITSENSTIIEFNPFEMGSWDPSLNSFFTDIKYIGTAVNNGTPLASNQCIAGFDNTGFILGTSSTLFTPSMQSLVSDFVGGSNSSSTSSVASFLVEAVANDYDDVAYFTPNPFKNANYSTNTALADLTDNDILYLADGGEDKIEIPLISLIQKQRDLDVVFALDISADTNDSWPDGTALVQAYHRQFTEQGKNISFPYVPDTESFIKLGLNKKPTFFGCDAQNLTDLAYIPPLVVYIPNSEYSFESNTSTFALSYSTSERYAMIQNGFEAASRGNLTEDSQFAGCIACAILRRTQQSSNLTLPQECESCFTNYCWNGTTLDSSNVSTGTNSTNSGVSNSSATTLTSSLASALAIGNSTRSQNSTRSSSSSANAAAHSSFSSGSSKFILLLLGLMAFITNLY